MRIFFCSSGPWIAHSGPLKVRAIPHGIAYEHDILKDALFVFSHNLHDSVPVNVSRVSFKNKIMSSLLVWSCDLTFVVFGVGQIEASSSFLYFGGCHLPFWAV